MFEVKLLCCLFIILRCFHTINCQKLIGLNFESEEFCEGLPGVVSKSNTVIRLLGTGLDAERARVVLVEKNLSRGQNCDDIKHTDPFYLQNSSENSAVVTINVEVIEDTLFYFCFKTNDSSNFFHQGTEKWKSLKVTPRPEEKQTTLLPFGLQIVCMCLLLALSGAFSGLTLGLMSLDPLELQLLLKAGTPSERRYAAKIYPIRKKGNVLLCTMLIGNVLVNSTMTVLLNELIPGTTAIAIATVAIVIFGEIVPQAFCSRYGLAAGAHTMWLTKFFMVATFIVSYPFGKLLDLILGKEIRTVYNREKLLEMLKVTELYHDLHKDEVNMIQGALELRVKKVQDAMTPIDHCYMVDISITLDFKTVTEIVQTGFTRIPVFDKEKNNLVSILFVKDLTFVDPDDCMPLRSVCQFYKHPLHFVDPDITLDKVFEQFKTGAFHMAIVRKRSSGDIIKPNIVGIITLEDVIEEIIKAEIVDETDVYTDNRRKKLNPARQQTPVDLSLFSSNDNDGRKLLMTPQLLLAVHRFMMAEIEPFKTMSEKILLMLLKQDVVRVINNQTLDAEVEQRQIYHRDRPVDFFVMVLEGQVKVVVGKENLEFLGGPFSFYGVSTLTQPAGLKRVLPSPSSLNVPHVGVAEEAPPLSSIPSDASVYQAYRPDYDLIAASDLKYIKIERGQYLRAMNAMKLTASENIALQGLGEMESMQDMVKVFRKTSRRSMLSRSHYVAVDYYDVKGIHDDERVEQSSPSPKADRKSTNGDEPSSASTARNSPQMRDRVPGHFSGEKRKRKKSLKHIVSLPFASNATLVHDSQNDISITDTD